MRKKDLLKGHVGGKLHVTPSTGPAFTGVLTAVAAENVEFSDVVVVQSGETAAGHLIIGRDNIAYLQVLADAAI